MLWISWGEVWQIWTLIGLRRNRDMIYSLSMSWKTLWSMHLYCLWKPNSAVNSHISLSSLLRKCILRARLTSVSALRETSFQTAKTRKGLEQGSQAIRARKISHFLTLNRNLSVGDCWHPDGWSIVNSFQTLSLKICLECLWRIWITAYQTPP